MMGRQASQDQLFYAFNLADHIPRDHLLRGVDRFLDLGDLRQHLAPFYSKPLFWHRAYFVGSVGGATLETVRAYVDAQGTEEHARKSAAKSKKPTASARPPPGDSALP